MEASLAIVLGGLCCNPLGRFVIIALGGFGCNSSLGHDINGGLRIMRAGHAFFLPTFTINLLEARFDRCSRSLFEKVFHSCAFIEGSSSSTMPIIGALFLSAMPGLALMFWIFVLP